jgi:octaprenyl-diphosphate synthase
VNPAQTRTASSDAGALADLLAPEMAAVEERLFETLDSRERRLTEIGRYLIGAGGKRVRPMVAMAVFRACGGEDPRDMIDVAVALELIHSATLLHDDIIDGGEVRRGRPSAYVRFGPADTLVAGDFLFSKAFHLCGRFEEKIVGWAAEACIALTEGEIMQGRFRRNREATVEDYREIIFRKTACIFQQGARVAAYLAGAPPATVDALARCGRSIGMAFQVVDDLLDVVGATERTGKPVGIDVRDGNPSLPIVLAMRPGSELERVWLSAEPTGAEIDAALREIVASGVLDRVREEALAFTDAATRELAALPANAYRGCLELLVRELSERAI